MNNWFRIIKFKYGYILVKYRVIIHLYIYLHVYLSNVIFLKSFLRLLSVFSTITYRDTTSHHRCSVNLSYSRNPDHLHREGVNNKKGRDGQSPAPSPRPKRPTGRPPRGARQWPYTNPRGARAYQKNPNCNAEWRSRILPPSQLGKSHGKTDSTINRLNSNEKSVNSLGVFRRGSGGENPRKCQKKPATSTCRPFAGLTGPTWSKHG